MALSQTQLLNNNYTLVIIGKGANLNEKKEATARAVKYVEDHGLPRETRIERVSEGAFGDCVPKYADVVSCSASTTEYTQEHICSCTFNVLVLTL